MPDNDLALLIDAAREAGQIASKFWRADPKSWDKPDNAGPVTEADLAVDEMLRDRLLSARPDYGWLSEETEDTSDRLTKDTVFVVDPIDGTRSFMAGERTWSHSVAVVHKGRPTAAVVFLPIREKLYAATPEQAWHNDQPISPSPRGQLEGADILAARPAFAEHHWHRVPQVKRHFRTSLAYRLCLVAEGRFDAMITLRPAWEWDIAAGALIASAAGAAISDQKGQPITFNSEAAKSDGVVVSGPNLHDEIIGGLRQA